MSNKSTIKDFIAATSIIALWIIIWSTFASEEFKQSIFKKENLIGWIIFSYGAISFYSFIKEEK